MQRKRRKHLTVRFLHRTLLFLIFFSYSLVLFFAFGNVQNFLDSTQVMIISVLDAVALSSSILAVPLFSLEIWLFAVKKRPFYLGLAAIALFGLVSGILLSAGGHFLLMISRGI